jgi:hypothetical protein
VEQENDTRLHQTTQNTAKQPNEAQADQLGKTQQVEKIDDQGYICQACTMSYKLGVLKTLVFDNIFRLSVLKPSKFSGHDSILSKDLQHHSKRKVWKVLHIYIYIVRIVPNTV